MLVKRAKNKKSGSGDLQLAYLSICCSEAADKKGKQQGKARSSDTGVILIHATCTVGILHGTEVSAWNKSTRRTSKQEKSTNHQQ